MTLSNPRRRGSSIQEDKKRGDCRRVIDTNEDEGWFISNRSQAIERKYYLPRGGEVADESVRGEEIHGLLLM